MYKSLVLAVTALAGIAAAQSLPACALSCVTLPAQCNGDPACICNDASWIADISCCVSTSCPAADQQAALDYARTYCQPVGATLPTAASCANSTASATGSAASSASSSASGASSSAASSASSALSSITGSASSAASSASSAVSSAASAASSAASSAAFGNQIVVPGAGGVLGAVLGALALL